MHLKPDAPEEFEAFVLQTFIQEMLPKEADNVFGSGIAGDIWKSLLSEKLAFEVAQRGDFGIAELVRGARSAGAADLGAQSAPVDELAATGQTGSADRRSPPDLAGHERS